MTNFKDPKPSISIPKDLPEKSTIDKGRAIENVVKIIRENKRIIEAARNSSYEDPHR